MLDFTEKKIQHKTEARNISKNMKAMKLEK